MPKNIVLLSDGTGNSAAKPFKTNVWRIYQAIDINPPKTDDEPQQVVFYDDGVGTESFKPLAYLGLALGFGLSRNVKDLYTFLCRNYSKGDNIFLFGFSRGAFTVRVLAGMIFRCGLIHTRNEAELREQVDLVYNAYIWDAAQRATATGRAWLLGRLFGGYRNAQRFKYLPLGDKITQRFPRIAFIGVWDTVDAYGMPVDEIKIGIDRFIWPMTLADRNLSPYVDRACHALSLDDERPTFRPVLWNEVVRRDGQATPVDEEQLTQVWFAGVHANVGGGYPDDGLAHVALQWMMDEAQKQGLWFYPQARLEVDSRANGQGKQYDSRSGLAGYYRYGPRSVDELCRDDEHGVEVSMPKVHKSVIDRIRGWEVGYAPLSFPSRYVVMERQIGARPELVPILGPGPESDDALRERCKLMETAWDAVARRRGAYFATVALTILLVGLPILSTIYRYVRDQGWTALPTPIVTAGDIPILSPVLTWPERSVVAVLDVAKGVLGGWSAYWLAWYQHHPLFFLVAALLLAWLFVRKSALLQREVFDRADFAWRNIRAPAETLERREQTRLNLAMARLRKLPLSRKSYKFLARTFAPFLAMIVVGAFAAAIAVLFFIPRFVRMSRLRRRYGVGRTDRKPGTEDVEIIDRKRCPEQPYMTPGSRQMEVPAPKAA